VNKDGTFGEGEEGRQRWASETIVSNHVVWTRPRGCGRRGVSLPRGRRIDESTWAWAMRRWRTSMATSRSTVGADVTTMGPKAHSISTPGRRSQSHRCRSEITLDSGSETSRLTRVKGPHLSIDSGSGRISPRRVDHCGATFNIDVRAPGFGRPARRPGRRTSFSILGSGSVGLDLKADAFEWSAIDSGSGERSTLAFPEALGAELEASTGSGGVDI
jgi:hypothetical protein